MQNAPLRPLHGEGREAARASPQVFSSVMRGRDKIQGRMPSVKEENSNFSRPRVPRSFMCYPVGGRSGKESVP